MITDQIRRQRADEIMAQAVREIHAVFPSPKLVPSKVLAFIGFLQGRFKGEWWRTLT